jgi:hypothetical protein
MGLRRRAPRGAMPLACSHLSATTTAAPSCPHPALISGQTGAPCPNAESMKLALPSRFKPHCRKDCVNRFWSLSDPGKFWMTYYPSPPLPFTATDLTAAALQSPPTVAFNAAGHPGGLAMRRHLAPVVAVPHQDLAGVADGLGRACGQRNRGIELHPALNGRAGHLAGWTMGIRLLGMHRLGRLSRDARRREPATMSSSNRCGHNCGGNSGRAKR